MPSRRPRPRSDGGLQLSLTLSFAESRELERILKLSAGSDELANRGINEHERRRGGKWCEPAPHDRGEEIIVDAHGRL
ncbi:MAG: hypothetical protein V3W32_05795 [Gemmatimonadota bacterium]